MRSATDTSSIRAWLPRLKAISAVLMITVSIFALFLAVHYGMKP